MKKNLLLLGLALLTAATASAAEEFSAVNSDGIWIDYAINTDDPATVSVIARTTGGAYSGTVNIPETVTSKGSSYTVTGIGKSAFEDCSGLEAVNLPNTMLSIGEYAFSQCRNMTSVTLGNSLTSIGKSAFLSCRGLQSVELPSSLIKLESCAFQACIALTEVTIPESVEAFNTNPFEQCSGLKAFYGKFASEDNRCLIIDGVLVSFAPADLPNNSYRIPSEVKEIGSFSCEGPNDLAEIIIPASVTSIKFMAFAFCKNLKTVVIESVTPPTLGSDVFVDSSYADATLYVPAGCAQIYNLAHKRWTEFSEIKEMNFSFAEKNDDDIYFYYAVNDDKKSVTVVNSQFANTTYSGSVAIPSTVSNGGTEYEVTAIGANAFASCKRLNSISIPEGVTSIGDEAFQYCWALSSISLPKSVTTIGENAFLFCPGLKSVEIWGQLSSIGNSAFTNCYALKSFTVSNSAADEITLGTNVFGNVSLKDATLYVPAGCKDAYDVEPWNGFGTILEVESGVEDINTDTTNADDTYYDLNGRRVLNPSRGIYIHGGRKVIVK